MYSNEKVTIIMPVYNEEKTVAEVIKRVLAQPMVDELVVIDDCSNDKSIEQIKSIGSGNITLVKNEENRGKGYSVRKGLDHVKDGLILIQDADTEYMPEDYPKLFDALKDNNIVFGTRMIGDNTGHHYMLAKIGNAFLTDMFNLLYKQHITDLNTCYKIFRKSMLEGITLKENGFLIEEEISIKLARKGYKIDEVPVSYKGRTYEEGKKIKMSDGFKGITYIFSSLFER
ncbi:MAG: glycosyltransferase family 2 protein [Candidatus Micrarchaeaceae archaeon]